MLASAAMLTAPLVEKHKRLARALLYGSAVLLPAAAWWLASVLALPLAIDTSWFRPAEDFERFEAVRLFQEYLRIDTSAPDGNEVPGAEFLARQLATVGIEAHIERIGSRNANLWAIIEGDDPRALVLHNHLDVEPAPHAELWRKPPFAGAIDPPWVIGRGAFDMKSVAIAQLLAVLELKRQDVALGRSLIFLATGDEETGSWLGTRWVLRNHPRLVARFEAVLTEGGAVEAVEVGGLKYWGTEVGQKRYLHLWACHHSRARLEALREDIAALDPATFSHRVGPTVARFMRRYAESRENPRFAAPLRDPQAMIHGPQLHDLPAYLQLMVRNDVFTLPVEEDPEGGYMLPIVFALLPGATFDQARRELLPEALTHGVALRLEEEPLAPPSSLDHPVYRRLDTFMESRYPGFHGPFFVAKSATDARLFRGAGIPSYGFSPFIILSTDTMQMKGVDERMAVLPFIEGVTLYTDLVRFLVTTDVTEG